MKVKVNKKSISSTRLLDSVLGLLDDCNKTCGVDNVDYTDQKVYSTAALLVSACMEARNVAHKFHLQTRNHATHISLDIFYKNVVELVDSFAECYQGRYGVQDYPRFEWDVENPIDFINKLIVFIDNNRAYCGSQQDLQAKIDDIQNLNNQTLYRLTNLS